MNRCNFWELTIACFVGRFCHRCCTLELRLEFEAFQAFLNLFCSPIAMLISWIRSPNCQIRLTKFFPLKATVEVVIGLVPSHTALEIRKMRAKWTMFAKERLWVTVIRMANRDNVTIQDHLILESMVAFRALEGHVVAVDHFLVRPQSVLGLELLVTHLTR